MPQGEYRPPHGVKARDDEDGKIYYSKKEAEPRDIDHMLEKFGNKIPNVQERATENGKRLKLFFSQEAERRWKNYSEGLRISEDELKQKFLDIIQPLVEKGDIWIRVPSTRLSRILQDGRFKNILETQIRSPGKNPKVTTREYIAERRKAENELFGFDNEVKPEDRPIYGYLTSDKDGWLKKLSDNRTDWLSEYGDCRIKIKRTVRPRCTFSMEDTLDINNGDAICESVRVIPAPIDKLIPEIELGDILKIDKKYNSIEDATSTYNEVSIHNGLPVTDIEEIVFERSLPGKPILNQLDKLDIKYRSM